MPKVLVLMSTYNGEKYLNEQLRSLTIQKNVDLSLCIRDDGSVDKTIFIINSFTTDDLNIKLYRGENLKPAKSFMWLVKNCEISDYEYFAFCDQDDVWLDSKLEKAICKLKDIKYKPALYYCATMNVDKNLNKIDKLFIDPIHTTSLIDSIARGSLIPGCTMVFNKTLMELLRKHNPEHFTMHDTWVHLICLSCGGIVIGDETPYILYRQHEDNVLGLKKKNLRDRLNRINNLNNAYSLMVSEIKENYSNYIADINKDVIYTCSEYRTSIFKKIRFIKILINSTLPIKDKLLFLFKILKSCF